MDAYCVDGVGVRRVTFEVEVGLTKKMPSHLERALFNLFFNETPRRVA